MVKYDILLFSINNRPYLIDNIVLTCSTFMRINAHDGEKKYLCMDLYVIGRSNWYSIVCVGHIHVMMEYALYTTDYLTSQALVVGVPPALLHCDQLAVVPSIHHIPVGVSKEHFF